MTGQKKPPQDWNIEVAEAMSVLSWIRNRTDIELSDKEKAALGAGRMALIQFLPGQRKRVTPDMVTNALLGCNQGVREAMAKESTPETVVEWLLSRAFATYVGAFNKYRTAMPSRTRPARSKPENG